VEVRRLEDKEEIFSILKQDRLYAAYAIGDLEAGLFEKCQWVAAYEDGTARALCLLFKGLTPNAVFCVPSLRAYYDLDPGETLIRMALTAAEFRADEGRAVRLTSRDIHALNALYRLGGGTGFATYQVTQGIFYGVRMDGKVIATAGTHVISPKYGIGCVGNVFTHPDYRGHGYAAVCTSAVVRDVLAAGCRDVVLNVRHDNTPAIHAYTRLGFAEHSRYQEAYATRRGSLRALLERLLRG
jgi:GNAT superfamily N-acetyltransferase